MKNTFSIILTSLIILVLSSCSPKKDNVELIAEVKTLLQQGKLPEAIINLKNVLQTEPKHSEARFILGDIYFQQEDFVNAEESIEKAVKNGYAQNDAVLTLAKIKLNLNKFEDVLTLLHEKTFTNDFDQTFALLLQGQAKLSLDKTKEATKLIKQANKVSAFSIHSIYGNALLLAYKNKFDLALKALADVIIKDKKYADAWLLKGSIHSSAKENKKAAEAYLKYFELKSKNIGIKILIARNFILAGEYNLARTHVEELRKINDNNPTVNVLAAQIAYIDTDYQLAKELADSAALASNNSLAQMISGLSSYNLKDFENAYYQLNAIAELLPKDHQVNKTLAILQLKLGYHDEFATSLSNLDNANSLSVEDAGLYASLGMEAVQQGDKENAKKMFERAVTLAPDNAELQAQLGILKLSKANNTAGVGDLKKALAINPNLSRANIALAMTYLQSDKLPAAKKVADDWRSKEPNNVLAYILSGNVALKSSETDDAINYFKKAVTLDENNITPLYSLAVIATSQEKYDESDQYLEQLISIEKEYPRAYQLLINNALKTGKENNLKQKFQQLITETPTALWPRIILSRRQIDEGQPADAIATLSAIKDYPVYPKVYFTQLIEAQIKSNNKNTNNETDQISATFKLWQDNQEENATAYITQINLLEKQKKYQAALTVAQSALKQDKLKNHLQLLTLESYYLLATTQTETANRKIRTLGLKYPENPFVLRLQGQLAMVHKKFPDAITYLSKSFELKPNTFTGIYLATSYKNNSQQQKAIDFLNSALQESPTNSAYKKYLAQLSIAGAPENAIKQYQELVANNPKDVVALNNLAWMLLQDGNSTQALLHAKSAAKLAPNNPQVLDTLGLILLEKNQVTDAIKALTTANNKLPNDIEILIHLAQAYKANNESDRADELVDTLSKENKSKWREALNAL
jgi:putative PEP-CTERM system TPR-repeat lipoprotein